MNIQSTGHITPKTRVSHHLLGLDRREPFASLRLDDDLAIIAVDPEDLERLAAQALAAANELRAAQATLEDAA